MLGEAPGAVEDELGWCFAGKSGGYLDTEVLEYASLRWNIPATANVWIDNVVRCRPIKFEHGKVRNRQPNGIELQACGVYTRNLISVVKPYLIICLGAVPARYIIHLSGEDIIWRRGELFFWEGRAVLPLHHPAKFCYDYETTRKETRLHIDNNRKYITMALNNINISQEMIR